MTTLRIKRYVVPKSVKLLINRVLFYLVLILLPFGRPGTRLSVADAVN